MSEVVVVVDASRGMGSERLLAYVGTGSASEAGPEARTPRTRWAGGSEGGSQGAGVVNKSWLDRVVLNSLYVQTLMSTDVQTPFLGTPLVPLKR